MNWKPIRTLAVVTVALPLAACIKFGAEPPKSLLTLNARAAVPVGETQRSGTTRTITIDVPSTPQQLAVERVPVEQGGTTVAYVKDAMWVDRPARLFARLLDDTLTQAGLLVLGRDAFEIDPGLRLSGQLRSFGVDADTREAVVTYDATLIRGNAGASYEKRRFEARVPVSAIETQPVGTALNEAANRVADDVAAWVGN